MKVDSAASLRNRKHITPSISVLLPFVPYLLTLPCIFSSPVLLSQSRSPVSGASSCVEQYFYSALGSCVATFDYSGWMDTEYVVCFPRHFETLCFPRTKHIHSTFCKLFLEFCVEIFKTSSDRNSSTVVVCVSDIIARAFLIQLHDCRLGYDTV
jgi:hypothetical protein